MNDDLDHACAEADSAAADWVARLQKSGVGGSEWRAFDLWLEQSPLNVAAYDRALGLSQELDRNAPLLGQRGAAAIISLHPCYPSRNGWRWAAMTGAVAATLVVGWFLLPRQEPSQPWQTLQTAKGEQSSVALPDGTRIDMAADTHMTVKLDPQIRQVVIDNGEAVFDVAKDSERPFLIAAGDRTIRVIGTLFDVRHRGDSLSVTVQRGLVEVATREGAPGDAIRLTPGKRLDHLAGTGATDISFEVPDEMFAWRSGRLVYRNRPLSEVVADLNAQFSRPVSLADRRLAEVKFSGVLVLDDEESVIHRLTLLTPLWSSTSPTGIVLAEKEAKAQ